MGMALRYERRGSGEPLVLIHGIAHRWQAWEPVLDRLAAHHDVIAVDLPGFGASPRLPPHENGRTTGIPVLLAALVEFLAEHGLDRPHVAGNSLGGALALELGAGEHARSVTALSPAGFASRPQGWWALALLIQHRAATYLPTPLLRWWLASPARRAASMRLLMSRPQALSPQRALGDALAMRRGKGFMSTARGLRGYGFAGLPAVPVTIAWGDRDRILVPRQAERARLLLPDARHVLLAGCGHVPMGDDADLVATTILETTRAGGG